MSFQAVELAQHVFDKESTKLRSVTNGSVIITYQYLSEPFVNAAHVRGEAIDLDPADGPLIGTASPSELLLSLCKSTC